MAGIASYPYQVGIGIYGWYCLISLQGWCRYKARIASCPYPVGTGYKAGSSYKAGRVLATRSVMSQLLLFFNNHQVGYQITS
jgi:hypothetical protein